MSGTRRYEGDPGPLVTGEEIRALVDELRGLRKALERNRAALMTQNDACAYVALSAPVFRRLVAKGTIPQTVIDDDLPPKYSRVALDRVIAERTTGDEQ